MTADNKKNEMIKMMACLDNRKKTREEGNGRQNRPKK